MIRKISDILKEKKPTYSFEFFPPKTEKGREKLPEIEKQLILKTLESHRGNKSQAARALGISRATVYRKLKAVSRDTG